MLSLALVITAFLVILYAAVRIAVDWWENYTFWRELRKEIRQNERKGS